jgi:hypothetical protein
MPRLSEKLQQLLREVSESGKRKSKSLVGDQLTESGLLDQAVLNEQIGVILEDASSNVSLAELMERHLEAFQDCIRQGNVPGASKIVCELLRLEANDLRRAALLSLMVRMAGKRKFDPVASYILENRAAQVTGQG